MAMKIFKIIARYDWLMLKNDRLLALLTVVLVALGIMASWNGLSRLHDRQNLITKMQVADQDNIKKMAASIEKINSNNGIFDGNHFRDPRKPATAGNSLAARYAILPPAPTSVLAVGQSDLMPYYYLTSTSKRQGLVHDAEIDNPQLLFVGAFDWAFLLVYLLPLLVISFTYNIVSSERENGTLSLILSEPVPFSTVVAYKFLFRYLLLNSLIISMIAVTLALAKAPIFSTDFALLVALIGTYSGFWFGLSFFINSLWRNSGYNASALVSAWLILLVVVPALLNIVVQQIHPMPSRIDLITQTREATDKAREKGNILLNAYYEDHPELVPKTRQINYDDFGLKSFATATDVQKALQPLHAAYTETLTKQQNLVDNYRFASPAIIAHQTVNGVAQTGTAEFARFEAMVTQFQQQLFNYFAPKVFQHADMTVADYQQTPQFVAPIAAKAGFDGSNILNLLFLGVLSVGLLWQGRKGLGRIRG
jgi:ABC-2 type transport system permease protein